MKSLLSLPILLEVLLIRTARAGSLDLQLGGLALNDKGLKLDGNKGFEDMQKHPGFTVMPSLKEVLDIHERTQPPGVEPSSKRERLNNLAPEIKKSYEDEIMKQLEKERPGYNEINDRRHKSGWAHVTGEEEVADAACPEGTEGDSCEKELLMWAAAPTDPKKDADKKLRKSKRDKKYEWAIRKGTEKATKDLKKVGGPDPYGGLLPPHIVKQEGAMGKNDSKNAKEELIGKKTLKNFLAKKGLLMGGKGKETTTKKEDEPDVATAPAIPDA